MTHSKERRLSNGPTVAVYRNSGLRKICSCPRRGWAKCPHPWHFNFCWHGSPYRFSLSRYAGKEITGKTEAEALADHLRAAIRAGTFEMHSPLEVSEQEVANDSDISFDNFGRLFLERFSQGRGKASWQDDGYMINQLVSFRMFDDGRLGEKPLRAVTEDDMEAFVKHLTTLGRASSTRNHYVQLIRAMSKWAVRKGYRTTPMVTELSDVIRRKKEAQRSRRLEPGEEERLLRAAKPHLQGLIIAALESCCREGELLNLRWSDVSLARGEIMLRAENTKDREDRTIPMSSRLRQVLEMRRNGLEGKPLPASAYVFGNEIGQRVGSIKRAWQTTVLRAHGHEPVWIWKKKQGLNDKGSTKLSPESQAAYRSIGLHFHDLRHEGGSRLLEAGWPVHHVQHMLGHASLQQTSTYLNTTLRGLHESMRTLEESRAACKSVASTPARSPRPARKRAPASNGNSFIH
jgi:integrase